MKKLNIKIIIPIVIVIIAVIVGIIFFMPTEEKQILSMIQTEFEKGYKSKSSDFKEIIDIEYETKEITENEAIIYGTIHYKNLYGNEFYSRSCGKFKIYRTDGKLSSVKATYMECGADIMVDDENYINRIK